MTAPRLVVSRAPLRVSFCGGGSDLPPPAGTRGQCGAVVSSSIDLWVYCVGKPRTDGRYFLSWMQKEVVDRPQDFEHSIVRHAFADLARDGAEFPGGVELSFLADVPGTGSGLGSSAATAAACLLALDALAEKYDGIHGRRALAQRSISVQPGKVRGCQDEYATVYGGLNAMRFSPSHLEIRKAGKVLQEFANFPEVDLSPLGEEDPGAAAWLQERFALFRPPDGAARSAAEVLATYKPERDADFRRRCLALSELFVEALRARDLSRAAQCVNSHSLEKEATFGAYGSKQLEAAEDAVFAAGGIAIKLCGAGGTGHLLVGFEPDRRAEVVAAAEKAWGKELKFRFGTEGAAVVYRETESNRPEKIGRS